MYRHEMSTAQVEKKSMVNRMLQQAGWDIGSWDDLLESDVADVTPEAVATYHNSDSRLQVEYHAREDYLVLAVQDLFEQADIRFRFYCGARMQEALTLITAAQAHVSRADYTSLLQDLMEISESSYSEAAGNLVKLEFEDE